jgi:hypothetical protein
MRGEKREKFDPRVRFPVKECAVRNASTLTPLPRKRAKRLLGKMPLPKGVYERVGASSTAPNARSVPFCTSAKPFTPLIFKRS